MQTLIYRFLAIVIFTGFSMSSTLSAREVHPKFKKLQKEIRSQYQKNKVNINQLDKQLGDIQAHFQYSDDEIKSLDSLIRLLDLKEQTHQNVAKKVSSILLDYYTSFEDASPVFEIDTRDTNFHFIHADYLIGITNQISTEKSEIHINARRWKFELLFHFELYGKSIK